MIMHLVSRTASSFVVGSLALVNAAAAASAGVLEIDVVFPRINETYAPTDKFPIVFALQNSQLAKLLDPSIQSFIRNGTELDSTFGINIRDLSGSNFTNEPFFIYRYLNVDTEGPYELFATASWSSCDQTGDQVAFRTNSSNLAVPFTIQMGGQTVDLVSATADDDVETCAARGVTIDVTDQTLEVPGSIGKPSSTCAVLAAASQTISPNPCRVKIDTAVAASISAVLQSALCKGSNPPADCPKENAAAKHMGILAGVATIAAAFGAIGFFLV